MNAQICFSVCIAAFVASELVQPRLHILKRTLPQLKRDTAAFRPRTFLAAALDLVMIGAGTLGLIALF